MRPPKAPRQAGIGAANGLLLLPADLAGKIVLMLQSRDQGVAFIWHDPLTGRAWLEVDEASAAMVVFHRSLSGTSTLTEVWRVLDFRRYMYPLYDEDHRIAERMRGDRTKRGLYVRDRWMQILRARRLHERRSPLAGRAAYWAGVTELEKYQLERWMAKRWLCGLATLACEGPEGTIDQLLTYVTRSRTVRLARAQSGRRVPEEYLEQLPIHGGRRG